MDTPTLPPVGAGAPISARSKNREPRPLIGEFIRRPEWLWLTHVAPIGLLLAWAGHTYWLVQSELNAGQRAESLVLAAALVFIMCGAGVMSLLTQRAGRLLGERQCAGLLLMSLAVLGMGLRFCWFTIPWSVPEWLANQTELLFESFCLGMPGAFYAILVLISRPLRRHGGKEFGILVGVTVLGALGFYGVFYLLAETNRFLQLPEWAGMLLALVGVFAGGTAITALITRATLITYAGVRRTRPAFQRCFIFLVAVCGPIGGLYLNKTIPFPVDLQAPVIYLLALLNGAVLMLPVVRSLFWHRVIWLAQCLLFPFSAYFFILFLPFLPLSLFAMIVAGAGFLVLVPLVLGITHTCRLADGLREEIRDGRAWPVAVMGLCAVLVLPAVGLWSTWRDREALDEALTYIYSPDYRKDITYPGSLPALASSLQDLRDAKQGIFLPFLTPLYNQVVFHGLVLPDAKITDLQAAFFGAAAAKSASVLLRSRNSDDNGFWTATDRPDHTVALDGVQAAEHPNGTAGTAELLLTMRNAGSGSAEYVGSIHLPEGVYVTGFALKIGDDFVPARIVERKTAQWVYEKITQIHRDPGLLTFTSRTDLSLKIAPFGPGQVRQARLQITYARTAPQVITFDSAYAPNGAARKTVPLGAPSTPAPLAVTTCATGAGSVAVADMADATRWQIRRTPYLNILIDCSRGTAYSDVSLANAIAQARQAFPDAKLARVTAINFEARDIMPNLVPVGQLNAADIRAGLLPDRGGLLQDRFLKRGLLLAHDLMQTAPDQARLRPQFVLISSLGQPGLRDPGLADFLQLVPDACVILAQNGAGIFHGEDPVSHQVAPIDDIPPVLLWNWDGHCEASAAQPRALVSFPGELSAAGPQIYDPQRGQFTPAAPVATIAPDTRFADGVRTWAAQDEAAFNPSLLKNGAASLIGLSKRTGILIPDSSYIAVESMAQWRLLEEKEKQKLANKQVFELEEPVASPEPATWLLLGLGLVVMILTHRRQKFTPRSARPPSREQSAPPLEPLPRSLA